MKTCQVSVQLEHLSKRFGETLALDIDNFNIHAGDVLGLVGNNGAGKTTLFRLMLDLLQPTTGSATFVADGVGYHTAKCEDWKAFTGAYIDSGFLIDYLTPDEYFSFIAKVNGLPADEVQSVLNRYTDFMSGEVVGQNKLIRNLSAGNKQKVGIVAALLHSPSLLILDEPFNFLDPSSQIAMKYMLEDYNRQTGATIIVSSHNLTHTLDICSRVALLEHGHIIKDYQKSDTDMIAEIENYFEGSVHHESVGTTE
ncbi:MAG: ABC transporter ATP-binding protein [Bacteroidaceae bacterium]|nr:ABC transporter ATP-binding protein [Bacteroidaceae bacterium]MBQ9176908.1 ABC transporter ATP-binding protein [Bacteroidaceae bacterium]